MQKFAIDMGKKEEQTKIKNLLVEAITLLCRNGLQYETKFSVEALIGITLDDNDVVLININEKFSNDDCTETYTSVTDKRREEQSFDNQDSNKQISIKNENFDEQVDFNNEEFDNNFQTHNQNVNDENNYFNSDSNNNNDDENDVQYDHSNTAENQLSENAMYIKSEGSEGGDGNNWMMNSNDYNNLELTDENYQKDQKPRSFRQGPYSSQMRRQRGRGRVLSRGFQRVRPQNNQNFMSTQQTSLQEGLVPLEVLNQISTHQTSTILALKKKLTTPDPITPNLNPTNNEDGQNWLQTTNLNKSSNLKSLKSSPQCWVCYRTFCSSQALKNHVDVKHLNKMAYKCNKCGECFKWRTGLCKHRRDICPYRFHDTLAVNNIPSGDNNCKSERILSHTNVLNNNNNVKVNRNNNGNHGNTKSENVSFNDNYENPGNNSLSVVNSITDSKDRDILNNENLENKDFNNDNSFSNIDNDQKMEDNQITNNKNDNNDDFYYLIAPGDNNNNNANNNNDHNDNHNDNNNKDNNDNMNNMNNNEYNNSNTTNL